jgi:thiamine pyrophosphokinase
MTHKPIRVILFVNGDLPAPERVHQQLTGDDFLIAVDGGLRHLEGLGLTPDLIIGDLDSVNEAQLQPYRKQGIEIRKFPTDKDETDLELALDAACDLNPQSIWVVAALGGRLDQTLANIYLLTRPKLAIYDMRLIDGHTQVFLIRDSAVIHGELGQRVSLLPLNGPAEGISTQGLRYPLLNETLYPDKTRGLSNQMISPEITIGLQSGLLLCIHETVLQDERHT